MLPDLGTCTPILRQSDFEPALLIDFRPNGEPTGQQMSNSKQVSHFGLESNEAHMLLEL
jgi:hypothetical protein